MKRVAFVTYKGRRDLNHSDVLVVALLAKKDITIEAAAWDDSSVDWHKFDAVILRSCWNYHVHFAQFLSWLEMLTKMQIPIWNPASIIKWNINKTYLFKLASSKIRIIPSILCVSLNLDVIRGVKDWDSLIIKPVVGTTSYGIKKFDAKSKFMWVPYVFYLLQKGPVVVQKYMDSVTEGEYSLIFFDKKFSHAVKKVPKTGDFRSQEAFGGSDISVVVSKSVVEQAEQVLAFIDEQLLYARVDGLVINGQFFLMELELTEPYLFLETDPSAPKLFADAISTWLNRYIKS